MGGRERGRGLPKIAPSSNLQVHKKIGVALFNLSDILKQKSIYSIVVQDKFRLIGLKTKVWGPRHFIMSAANRGDHMRSQALIPLLLIHGFLTLSLQEIRNAPSRKYCCIGEMIWQRRTEHQGFLSRKFGMPLVENIVALGK